MSGRYTRREALAGLGWLGAASMLGTGKSASAAGSRPNIVFIMSDDHAAHALSCYGSAINATPQIDRIAKDGVRLANCFCTNAICAPSRAVILTGKYSHLNGVVDNAVEFDGSQQTFPKLLQKAGYQTGLVGKWHLKTAPQGFDYWNVLPGQGDYVDPVFIEGGEKKRHQGYVSDLITGFSTQFIENRDKAKPFCLLCQHKAPHRSWNPDEPHANLFDGQDIPEPKTFDDDYAHRASPAMKAEMRIERDLTRDDLKMDPPAGMSPKELKHWKYERYIKDYLRVVASVDDNVGRLLDYLDKSGLAEDTIVIYTSDQGFFLGDHGWFDKRFMYEPALRMPFLMRYPHEIKPGAVRDAMVLNVDFAPTFLDFAGVKVPADMQGRSARRVLAGDTPKDWRTSMYYHYYEFPAVHMVRRHYGVRTERHKLIHYYGGAPNVPAVDEWELFDLQKDPDELRSVYDDPAYADVRKTLEAELARLRKDLRVPLDKQGGETPA